MVECKKCHNRNSDFALFCQQCGGSLNYYSLKSDAPVERVVNCPSFIYLQLDGDGGDEYSERCATWSEERIYDTDIKYKRAE